MNTSFAQGEQSLIFLNRRGSAKTTLCQKCSWRAVCPRCDLPLTYHGDTHRLQCHTCGKKLPAVTSCPQCGNADITFRGIGTKALTEEVQRLFPEAKVKRFDTDSSKQERLENQYHEIVSGAVDILVGTQLVTKGLDLPNLSTVGVVQADTSLSIPDYTSNELTYQQLSQIIGRVGRGHRPGKVFIQTYEPANQAIQAAINRDYAGFYTIELKEREQYLFPPFCFLLKLQCGRRSRTGAEATAHKLSKQIQDLNLPVQILGPYPAFHEKMGNTYRWQLVIKAKQRAALLEIIKILPSGWTHDLDPASLL